MKDLPINYLKLFVLTSILFLLSGAAAAQANLPCTPPLAGQVTWYPGDGNAVDVQSGKNGDLNGGTTFTTAANGKVREAFTFDGGSNSFVNIPDSVANNNLTGTWEFWFKTTQTETMTALGLIGKHDSSSSFNGITIYLASGQIGVQIKPNFNSALSLASGAGNTLNNGQFHHVALTFQSGGTAGLYVDGKLMDSGNVPSFSFNANPVRIGRTLDNYWEAFNGVIDEFSIYNRTLAPHEIQGIYNSSGQGKCKPINNQILLASDSESHSVKKHDAQTGAFIADLIPNSEGGLGAPYGMVFDGSNALYVADYTNDTIKRYDVRTGAFLGDLNNGASAMNGPVGMRIGYDGKLYVAEELGNRVLRFDLVSGTFDSVFVVAGSGGLSLPYDVEFVPDTTSDGVPELVVSTGFNNSVLRYNGATGAFIGLFSNANMSYPNFMTLRSDNLLYVSNYNNNTVTRYNATTGAFVDTFASDGGMSGFTGLAFGADGNLVISKITNTVRRFSGTSGMSLGDLVSDANLPNPTGLLFVPALCTNAPAGQVAFYTADGTAEDAQGANEGTLQNGAFYASGKAGNAAFSFDGVDDYVDLGNWSPGASYTVEAWINSAVVQPGARRGIFGGFNDCNDWGIALNNGQIVAGYKPANGNCTETLFSNVTPTPGRWYHVAAASDGSTLKIYVDGIERASTALSSSYAPTTLGTRIGGESCCAGNNFNGLVDEAAIYNRPLSASEINSIYSAGKGGKCRLAGQCALPPAQMTSWWRAEGNASDILGLYNGNESNITYTAGEVGQGFQMNGTSSFVSTGTSIESVNLYPESGSFTVAAWIKTSVNSAAEQMIVSKFECGGLCNPGIRDSTYQIYVQNGVLVAYIRSENATPSGVNGQSLVGTIPVADGFFHHVALQRNVLTNEMSIFVDGIKQSAPLNAGAIGQVTTGTDGDIDPLEIGARRQGGGSSRVNFFSGVIDEVEYFNRALSLAEIRAVYNAGTAGKCLAPNLSVSVSGSPANVYTNQNWDLAATISNTGLAAASGVKLTAMLPAGVQFIGASHMDCTAAGQIVTCNIGTLAANRLTPAESFSPDAVINRTITVKPTQTGALNIPFNVTANEADLTVANNFFAANVNVLAPTAAVVSIGGRVTTADGRGIRNAAITLIDNDGSARTVISGTFGYYRFDDIVAGQNVILRVAAKRFQFVPDTRVVNATEDFENVNFTAQP